jgi:hypothetical protein
MKLRSEPEEELVPNAYIGTLFKYEAERDINGTARNGYLVHPPVGGWSAWEKTADVPAGASLRFWIGKLSDDGDGHIAEVWIREDVEGSDYETIFSTTNTVSGWYDQIVALDDWTNKTVRLKFVVDCGTDDNNAADHAFWSEVHIDTPGIDGRDIEPLRSQAWFDATAFNPVFYFQHLPSAVSTVDLELLFEGGEPVEISGFTVHAAPDVIAREFENGAVLANPSDEPFSFPMDTLFPGRSFRRLTASPYQDAVHNDGSAVGTSVTVDGKDALFLEAVE